MYAQTIINLDERTNLVSDSKYTPGEIAAALEAAYAARHEYSDSIAALIAAHPDFEQRGAWISLITLEDDQMRVFVKRDEYYIIVGQEQLENPALRQTVARAAR